MAHAARSRAAYRRLLRAVDTHITAVGGNTTWREAVRHRFRAATGDRGTAVVEEAVRRAEDLAFLVNSVNNHKARAPVVEPRVSGRWRSTQPAKVGCAHSLTSAS